jgi:hypothetical protein
MTPADLIGEWGAGATTQVDASWRLVDFLPTGRVQVAHDYDMYELRWRHNPESGLELSDGAEWQGPYEVRLERRQFGGGEVRVLVFSGSRLPFFERELYLLEEYRLLLRPAGR